MVKIDNESVLAYFAGFLDGDGAITALIDKKRVIIEVALYNNCRDVLKFAKSQFLIGSLKERKWSVRSDAGSKLILQQLLPYLIVRRNQAEIALQLLESKSYDCRLALAIKIADFNAASKRKFSIHRND